MEVDTYKEYLEDMRINNERERQWRVVFEDTGIGTEYEKSLKNYKRCDVYMSEKIFLTKGGYYVEVSGCDRKKLIWEVVDDNSV